MNFSDRAAAGRLLGARLNEHVGRAGVLVLGIPRGGVPVAFEVAAALKAPMDVFVLRKLGVPEHEELAFGAIASGGIRVLDDDITGAMRISDAEIERITAAEKIELERREQAFRAGRTPLYVAGQTVILVDDGIATGSGMRAAIEALRKMKPARLAIAAPVAPEAVVRRLRNLVDEIVCVETPETFYGVGQFYSDFGQVSDEKVRSLMERAGSELRGL